MNIGPRERRKRLILGVAALGVAVLLALAGQSRWWRVGLFFLFWLGALGLLQAKEKT